VTELVTKTCSWCRKVYPIDFFSLSGGGTRRPECRACRRKHDQERCVDSAREHGADVIQQSCGVRGDDTIPRFSPEEKARWNRNMRATKNRLMARAILLGKRAIAGEKRAK